MRNRDRIYVLSEGQKGCFSFRITAREGAYTEAVGAVKVNGEDIPMTKRGDALVTPVLPAGRWAMEIRVGGYTATQGFFKVIESPLANTSGEMGWLIEADLTTDVAFFDIKLNVGPQGEQGDSAYIVWLNSGHEGTEEDFFAYIKGERGEQGIQGEQGVQGEKGDTGDKGDKGDKGEKGDKGDKGDTGNTGEKGDTGDTGLSAYQYAVSAGYVGTETEFAAGLQDSANCADHAAASATVAAEKAVEAAAAKNACLALQSALEEHIPAEDEPAKYHVTIAERQAIQRLDALFPASSGDTPSTPTITLPADAVPESYIQAFFASHAQPGVSLAPGRVYVSRVPWARWENGQWVNNASTVDESVFSVKRKFMDNAPGGIQKQHACSTDAVLGADDYVGKEWMFFWHRCNYNTDEYGNKYITAIEGQVINGVSFDPTKNVGTFGPAFWFFVCLERYQDSDGDWLTSDGTEDSVPLFQLWGGSDRAWNELDDDRLAELTAHGVTEDKLHIWPECLVYNSTNQAMEQRCYWLHSAYMGGYELDDTGTARLVSKRNCPLWNNLSHDLLNSKYGGGALAAGKGGSASVNGFGVLFDIIKNATKNSQNIHMGNSSNNCSAVTASKTTQEAGYIFPVASQGNFRVGCTVWLNRSSYNSTNCPLTRSEACQIGRISSIENRTFLDVDGNEQTALCLVFDPDTVEPFYVRTTAADAQALNEANTYAHCHATQGIAMAGETDAVLGKHDGSCTSLTDGKHPYRVQGTEYMGGLWIVAADTVAVKGNGSTDVVINGETVIPTSSQYIIFQARQTATRRTSGSVANYRDGGYNAMGLATTTGGYIVNTEMSSTGILYPVGTAGTGASTGTGHGDNLWVGASPAEFLMGGNLDYGAGAGSASLTLLSALSFSSWYIGGRD